MSVRAYKLVRVMADGSLSSLFIGKRNRLPLNTWLDCELLPTKGFAVREGWHCTSKPIAPHLSEKGRIWVAVEIADYEEIKRPKSQGGLWYLAKRMRIINTVEKEVKYD